MHDIIIVGAGAIGLYTAKLLEENNLNILILEKHKEIGNKACSGLVSTRLKNFVRLGNWVENKIKNIIIHSQAGNVIKLERPNTLAYVIDREKLDCWLSRQVKSKILFGTRVENIRMKKDWIEVRTNKGFFRSKLLVGCDGANSIVAKYLGVNREIISGLMMRENKKNYSNTAEIWVDKNLINNGFFWLIPRGKNIEYGALGRKINFKLIENFFRLKNKKCKRMGGIIPIGLQKTYSDRILLIGDAACQIKPWSCGGLIYGLIASKIACKVILKTFEIQNFSENILKEYKLEWEKVIGKNIELGLFAREIYKDMDNKQIEKIFKQIKNLDKIDFDFPFKL